jgi:hypothetical protein
VVEIQSYPSMGYVLPSTIIAVPTVIVVPLVCSLL